MSDTNTRDAEAKRIHRVVIIEDQYFTAKGMEVMLEAQPDIEVVGYSGDHTQVLSLVETGNPDVALVDLKLSGNINNGIEVVRGIKQAFPAVKCIVLTSFPELSHFLACVKAGAKAFLCKDGDPQLRPSLPELVRTVVAGGRYFDPELVEQMVPYFDEYHLPMAQGARTSEAQLTPREYEVLDLLIEGKSNQEIAEELVISPNTVKIHVANVCTKLGAEDRHQAALIGISLDVTRRAQSDSPAGD